MFGFSRGLAAFTLESGGLVALFSYSSDPRLLAGYLAAHAAASALAASLLLPMLPAAQRSRPLAVFLFFFAFCFFVPVLGVAGMLGAVVIGRLIPLQARAERFELHSAPVYDPRSEEVASVRSKGAVRLQLSNTAAPTETRLRALLAVQSLPARIANPVVREILSDPSDDLRLVAYGILDAREKSINARIHAATQRLERGGLPAGEQASVEKQLAELYWELIYQGLVQGDLRAHAAAEARAHLSRALALEQDDPALWSLDGRLAAADGDFERAQASFEKAAALGLPQARVLPYLAEVAFRRRRFDELRVLAAKLGELPQTQRMAQVVKYWNAAGETP
jgi:Flp pilus assembly protein TadD